MTAINHYIVDSSRTCSSCHATLPLTAKYFRIRGDRPSGFGYTCKTCQAKRTKDSTAGRRPYKGKRCYQCEDQHWRRPEDGRACQCGKFYSPLPPVTVEEAMMAAKNYERMTVL